MKIDTGHFRHRVLQDAFTEATNAYWERRARDFEAARPRSGDYLGAAGISGARRRWYSLTGVARACRARASIGVDSEQFGEDMTSLFGEVG